MKIVIDTDKKSVLVEDKKGSSKNYPTADPADILLIVAEELVPRPSKSMELDVEK